ncbi:uncharacterized protein LOC119962984 [Scyliorhinus canicula]|uniref:uncharacterized protein LOC119962984 n=1 Tax=Scyliorhinus canicula TaxID=7830 RepID=UPI0018F41704|nr:uncharacterized protein LOC119962984 [Scyliorhinus canicula]
MARMVLLKMITIALAVYIICLSDFFLPSEGDIVNVLMGVCIDPTLSNKVTNLSSLLGFMNITRITSCSQNGTRRRMTEIEVSLNHSSNARNRGKLTCQDVTAHFIATGWFTCKTKEKHTQHQGSPPQVSKIMISITDRSVITGISGLKIPNKINATWNYSSVNGTETNTCYMEIQFHNSTEEDSADQSRNLCTKNDCNLVIKRRVTNDPCYRATTNYLAMIIKDMNRTAAETSRQDINVAWNIHSPDGMQITKCSTHIQLQNPSAEYQEQNCVLDIIWLALFPTVCVILLIIVSYQLFKKDSSCKGENSSQQEAAVYINVIQHEECRRQPSGHVTWSRENHHPAPIANYQGENSSQQEAAVYINVIQHEECRGQPSGHVTWPIGNYQAWNNIRRGSNQQTHKGTCSAIAASKTGPNKGVPFITPPLDSSKQQNSDSAAPEEYTNVHCEVNEASFKDQHPSGIYDSVQLYCNMQQPNSVRSPGYEYANFLDLAACTPDLHRDHNHSINTAKEKRGFMCF